MKIAVIGGGGREHAIIKKLNQSKKRHIIVAIPGNGGIAEEAECVPIKATNVNAVVNYCTENSVDYVVVTPDDPLAIGMVDALKERGIPAFGPSKAAAQIEASKVFSKNLMQKYGIPTASFHTFTGLESLLSHLRALQSFPVVIKADGLALGKGVFICENLNEAEQAAHKLMHEKCFGESGASVVVEEYLTGPEVTVLAFCDGEHLVPMISSMDHKRAQDGDEGPNTGGMGVIAPNPFYTKDIADRCMSEIFVPTVRAIAAEAEPFKGCLYFGLMLTPQGAKVIEYNCRFGDPETQAILPLLQSDLLEIMLACTNSTLSDDMVRFGDKAAACITLASGGYPGKYETGFEINGLYENISGDVQITHAGTKAQNGALITAGGRVLNVTATAQTLADAVNKAYAATEKITFKNMHYRRDIGKTALL